MREPARTRTGRPSRRPAARALAALAMASWLPAALPAAAAQPGELLAEVKARGVLKVANTQTNPPWSFRDERNEVVGYDADVARELAKRMGIPKVEFIQSTYQAFILGVQTDKYDMVVSGQTITDERKKQVDFSEPYQVNGVSIFVNAANQTIRSKEDLPGKRIAVTAGTTNEQQARQIPNAEVKTYENGTLALTDVGIGRADASLISRFLGSYLAEKNNLRVKPLQGFLTLEVNAMSFKKGESAFKAEVDRALAAVIADGTLSRISKQWLGGLDMAEELKALPK